MKQLSLSFDEFKSRLSDPLTSHVAGESVKPKLAGLRAEFVEGVRRCGGKATANEAAAAMSDDFNVRQSIRKRAAECVRMGMVKVGGLKICNVSGGVCTEYEVK